MWDNGHDAYLETRVLTADPLELVNLLYEACTQAVREARVHLAEGRIAERSRQINRACQIVIELTTSLDHERGGELAGRLALLYDYMQRRLLEANMHQTDAPLADVLGLLSTLSEAWSGVSRIDAPAATESTASKAAPDAEPYTAQPEARNSWGEPPTDSPWISTVADSPWIPPVADTPWSPTADNPWAQPAYSEAGYSLQG